MKLIRFLVALWWPTALKSRSFFYLIFFFFFPSFLHACAFMCLSRVKAARYSEMEEERGKREGKGLGGREGEREGEREGRKEGKGEGGEGRGG